MLEKKRVHSYYSGFRPTYRTFKYPLWVRSGNRVPTGLLADDLSTTPSKLKGAVTALVQKMEVGGEEMKS